ncbi:cytochrome P450 [Frankia nepalensis]|uniref:Cytochrome P450 n=1 Tax=Frankia nepalensis TaxID=1836974 RepID=A0A937RJK2_9ACTN|nr:cytochrome P450 [Frankia nepalensis]MBL7495759.1 cytochrome P450 [Frankia nepalensis]MBL7513002.1 cytochrome P450 [Frankia nepalensis]MBL7627131.1 cytochrome P450 [Frankia nepalensis]
MTTTSAAVDLYDPDTYLAGPPHAAFAALRQAAPVHWQPVPAGPAAPGYWAVLGYAEVDAVLCDPVLFSSERAGVVLDDLPPDRLAQMRDMLLAMDPPRHRDYRRPLAHRFTHRAIALLEDRIRAVSRSIMAEAAERGRAGEPVEFVGQVAGQLPTRVVGELMGLPREDWDYVHRLSEANNRGQDDSYAAAGGDGGQAGKLPPTVEMALYAAEFAARRRAAAPAADDRAAAPAAGERAAAPGTDGPAAPAVDDAAAPGADDTAAADGVAVTPGEAGAAPFDDDLTSLLLTSDFGGRRMSNLDYGSFFVQLVTAGNDTTQTMLSSGLRALLTHPDQLAALRADPALIPGAVEEILRWANPLHYFRRTATADAVVGGVQIRAGDRLATYFTAANRDESVFDDPDRFDIRRSPNRHLSFGKGEHFCLGAHLARLEGKIFFEELLAAFSRIELADTPVRVRSNLNNGLKSLPIRLAA